MIVRLFHADKTVRQDLVQAIEFRRGYVLATQLQGPRNLHVEDKVPFKEILEVSGTKLDLVVVIDEGKPEGMWRDPFGELCERLFAQKRDASAATAGYLLLRDRQLLAWFRKALWDPVEDAEEITAYLARSAPDQFRAYLRPKAKVPEVPKGPPKPKPKKTPIINVAAVMANPRPPPPVNTTPTVEFEIPGARASPGPETTPEMPSVILSEDLFGAIPPDPADAAEDEFDRPRDPDSDTHPHALGDDDDDETVAGPPPVEDPGPMPIDPYAILGIPRGSVYDEAKKAYRALILQYHPDKVAHLAPEFRQLAETRTRDLNEAFAMIEKALDR